MIYHKFATYHDISIDILVLGKKRFRVSGCYLKKNWSLKLKKDNNQSFRVIMLLCEIININNTLLLSNLSHQRDSTVPHRTVPHRNVTFQKCRYI